MLQKTKEIILGLCCLFELGWRSIVIVMRAKTRKINKEFINQSIREGSRNILRFVRADYSIKVVESIAMNNDLPCIYISNHLSFFDLPLIMATLPGTIRLVVKKELGDIPLFGAALRQTGQILIDRGSPETMNAFFEEVKLKLKNGIALWVFPEGTRSTNGEILPFKIGAFRLAHELGAQIIPVFIKGTDSILPKYHTVPKHHQKIELRIGAAIDSRPYSTMEQQKILMDKTAEAINSMKNI